MYSTNDTISMHICNTRSIHKDTIMNIKLKKLIVSKLEEIDEIPYVNNGGCAVVAINLYRYILKLGFYPQIVYLDNDYGIRENLNGGHSCAHAFVKVGEEYFDSTGWYTYSTLPEKHRNLNVIELSEDYVEQAVQDPYNWNDTFDRENIPKIERILAA